MSFFSWTRWLDSLRRPRGKSHKKRSDRFARLNLESLEDRTLMAVLPAAVVSNPTTIATGAFGGFSPDVVQDPLHPLKMVEVHTTGALLVANYSIDGGQTWNGFINTVPVPNLAN